MYMYRCLHVYQTPEETAAWATAFLCMHPSALQVYNAWSWSQTGATSGLGCVPIREGSDPNWDNGLKQICAALNKPYNGGAYLLYQYDPPRLSTITPPNGPTIGGTSVTIVGTGFGISTPSVAIGGKPCSVTSTPSHTKVTCTSGSGEGKTNTVTMTVNGQAQAQAIPLNFRYDPPTVSIVDPSSAPTSGGAILTISGSNFGPSQGTVAIGTYYCPLSSWTDTVVKCTLPPGMGASLSVVLTTFDGVAGNTNVVFSFDKPSISSITPSSYYTQGSIPITLAGASFGGTGVARVGGALCVTITWTHTQITCTLPAGSGSQSPVTVTTASQVNTAYYFVYYAPVVIDVQPTSATSGTGVYLTLTGTSFGTSSNGVVRVNGIPCTSTSAQYTDIRILCALPAGTGYKVAVVVNVNGQSSSSSPKVFTYTPAITGISSTSKPTQGTTTLTLTGTSFASSIPLTSVKVAGANCTVTGSTATQILCTLPAGQGTSQLVALTVDGLIAPTSTLSYDAPTLTLVSPTNGPTGGSYFITLTGTNFGTSAKVTVGLVDCPISVTGRNHTQIICTVGAGSGQSNPVVVTVPVDGQQSNSLGFNYNPPSITGINPPNGAIDGGIAITLTGTDFASSGLVTIGTVVVSSTYVSSTKATFILPAGSGIVNVLIRIDSQSSNAVTFTYDGPSVLAVTPLYATTDALTPIALTGTSFGSGAKVYIGGILCPAYGNGIQSSTRYDCLLQPGQGVLLPIVMKVATQISPEVRLFNFTQPYINQPVSPDSGTTAGGNLITITGTSFGTSGIATIGNQVCQSSSWIHNKIVCSVPVGQGVQYIVRVQVSDPNGYPSQTTDELNIYPNIRYYSYSAPTITSLDPNPGPTAGMREVIIKGTNFGTYATVTIGDRVCPPSFAQSHVQYACILPRGQGTSNVVNITVGPQSGLSTYDYAAPTITSITPLNGPTDGNTMITVTGTGFGEGTAHSVVFGDVVIVTATTVVNTTTQTQMTFATPVGTGIKKSTVITVAGQSVTSSATYAFSYDKPSITSVSGCTASDVMTVSCPVTGLTPIVLTGSNYGTDPANVTITIGGQSCPLNGSPSQTSVSCTLPANSVGGFNLPVIVTVSTQSATVNYLSYSGPALTSGTLDASPADTLATSYLGNMTMTTSAGGRVTMNGTYLGSIPANVEVHYGHSNPLLTGQAQFEAKQFVCNNIAVSEGVGGVSTLECDMQTGTGRDLVFQVKVGDQYSIEGIDMVNYPRPVIRPTSIRLSDETVPGEDRVVGVASEGDVVIFDVDYLGSTESLSLLSVKYGPVDGIKDQVCSPVTTGTYGGHTYIQCTTSPGFGSLFVFEVTANGQTSAPGTDYYSYVQSPVVYSVSGCASDANNATFDCPTTGGTIITVKGDNFGYLGLGVRIGTRSCIGVTFISVFELTCTVPAGTGSPTSVVVIFGQRFSRAVNSLSYASATVNTISGCTNVGSSTTECPRTGGNILVLTGSNFGPANPAAIVVVGSQYCANVIHDSGTPHTKLTCTLPTGTDLSVAVLFRQGQGVLTTTTVSVSYEQCGIGRYAASGVLTCQDCSAGSYADDVGQASCKACDSGTYIGIQQATVCSRCTQGTYSVLTTGATIGATTCSNCSIGTYGVSDGASACSPCVGGYYANGIAQTTCIACSTGSHMKQSTGQTYCTLCEAGKYMGVTAAFKDECNACPSGRYSSVSIMFGCVFGIKGGREKERERERERERETTSFKR
jgi:hypothetical protein